MEDEVEGVVSLGMALLVETFAGSGVFFEFAYLTNFTPPDSETEDVETTHQKSPGGVRQYRPGLTEGGVSEYEINFVPGNGTHVFYRQWKRSREVRQTRIVYNPDINETYPAYAKTFSRGANLGERMTATLGLKVAGESVWSDE